MKVSLKKSCLLCSILPSLGFAIQPGLYGDLNIGVSSGPVSVAAASAAFLGSGGTLTGGETDVYGLNTQGAFGLLGNFGYNFTPYFGVEANYTYWGQQDLGSFAGQMTTATGKMSGDLYSQSAGGNVVVYFPVAQEKFNFYGKVGVAALFSTLTVNDPHTVVFFNQGTYAQSATEAGLTYGLGVQYQCSSHVSVLIAWNGISQFNDAPVSNLHYNMGSMGVRFTWPKE